MEPAEGTDTLLENALRRPLHEPAEDSKRRRRHAASTAAPGAARTSFSPTAANDHDKYRRLVRDLGVKRVIARRGTEHGSGPGTQRRVVERAFAHPHWFRRLRIRWEIRDDIHEAFRTLGCALICRRRLATALQRPVPAPKDR
ncbi:hypothetical protein [Embleya sp. NPDC005971]|uniref:hypothetical protein n=1 Tax=Embleya sp. NPDC005971 TaxID=3156724 RepID=UPI0033EF7C46